MIFRGLERAVWLGLFAVCAQGSEPPITDVGFAPDGKSVVACSQSGVHVFDWPGLERKRTIVSSSPNLHAIGFSPNGRMLAVGGGTPSEEGTVEVFSWPGGEPIGRSAGHTDSVMAIAWRGDTTVASASLDKTVILTDAISGRAQRTFTGHSRGVASVCFLKDPNIMVSAGIDQSLRVWNAESGELIRGLAIHTMRVHDLALRSANDGLPMVASASDDRSIRLWQPTIGRMVRFARLNAKPLDIEWLADGSRIAAACTDGNVYIVNADTVEVTGSFEAMKGWAYSLAVHPTDGTLVVGGRDGQLKRVNVNAIASHGAE